MVAKVGADDLDKSTTLESNKSHEKRYMLSEPLLTGVLLLPVFGLYEKVGET